MLQENSDLVKGFYSLFNGSKEGGLTYHKKKGSEIKSALQLLCVQINKEKEEHLKEMEESLKEISFKPSEDIYFDKEYKHLLEYIPKKFSYNQIYNGETYISTENGIDEQAVKKPSQEEIKEMREYNKHAQEYLELCINKIKLEALKKNIQENKSYNLSVNQLAVLGL
jgi:hypothetical protein